MFNFLDHFLMIWGDWYGNLYIFGQTIFRSYLFLIIGRYFDASKKKMKPLDEYILIDENWSKHFWENTLDRNTYIEVRTDRCLNLIPLHWEPVVDAEIIAFYNSSINNLHIFNNLLKLLFSKSQDNSDWLSHRFLQDNFTTFDLRWTFFNYHFSPQ